MSEGPRRPWDEGPRDDEPRDGESRDDETRDVDLEFARLLEAQGVLLPPGQAPREPAALDDSLRRSPSADSPHEPPTEEQRAQARAAHPSRGRRSAVPRELEAGPEDDLAPDAWMGDFVPPDPDLPQPSSRSLWSWTALIVGVLVMVVVAVIAALPTWVGALGALAALGGVISLLMHAPTHRDGDGVEV